MNVSGPTETKAFYQSNSLAANIIVSRVASGRALTAPAALPVRAAIATSGVGGTGDGSFGSIGVTPIGAAMEMPAQFSRGLHPASLPAVTKRCADC